MPAVRSLISIIIPTLNEASSLRSTLESVMNQTDCEYIVSDGGSDDRTIDVAGQLPVTLITSPRGRAVQMNAGARQARGEILLFLHADTRLTPSSLEAVRKTLQDPAVVGGAFQLRIDSDRPLVKFIERIANLRSRYLHLPYGDQALFVRRSTFESIGGFTPWPLMEDVDFVRRLRQRGRVHLLPETATTSARRWEREGVAWTTLRNGLLLSGFCLGLSPGWLAKWYRPVR